ncbi:MAG: S8 family serine peptidase [Bacteroidales bacterium]
MKKILLFLVMPAVLMLGSCKKTDDNSAIQEDQAFVRTTIGDVIPGQYIVRLKEGATDIRAAKLSYSDSRVKMVEEMKKILSVSEISVREPLYVYTASIEGFTLKLSDSEAELLTRNEAVASVSQDRVITLAKPAPKPAPETPQQIPWGITRVGGATKSQGKVAWIIDTGIDLDHPDLIVGAGATFVPRTSSADDDNGHGTHCAGIIAAVDNSIGVVGVAAGATVIPIKVLDKRGSGTISGVIAGVDYVADHGSEGDAVNMSLGGGISTDLDKAVTAMGGKGLLVALAAGNESDDANNHSPARVEADNIWTVSAFDSKDVFAYFSNYGNPPIDFSAPGVSIYSTYKGGQYATMSGTSMAAPHMCGVLLVTGGNPKDDGTVTGDPDGEPDLIVYNQ